MIDESSQPTTDQLGSALDACSFEDQRRELELELIKVRAEAEAARLEARAAELELTIRRMSRSRQFEPDQISRAEPAQTTVPAAPHAGTPDLSPSLHAEASAANQHAITASQAPAAAAFSSWDAVRSAAIAPSSTADSHSSVARDAPTEPPVSNSESQVSAPAANEDLRRDVIPEQSDAVQRIDSASSEIPRPYLLDFDTSPANLTAEDAVPESSENVAGQHTTAEATPTIPFLLAAAESGGREVVSDAKDVAIDADAEAEQQERRRSPGALLVSTVLHVVILVMLAAFTLSNQEPKDQISISASASNPSEVSMETFAIETNEPESEPTEPSPSETEYELSPLGEIKVTEFAPEAPPAAPASAASAMLSTSQMSAASMALKSDSDAKIQFCGVEGGGNHFVYLVDSSRSMRDGFESARAELLQSIDVLKPDQRFYVVFFDAESDYMRLADPNQDESRSVQATAQNKQALKRWAMRITKDDGRAPYDPLKFALELRPDVIFLLSDGEFPQGIEDLLNERNHVENLFGDSGPISIVHTIGYHSREGESRMRRIAEQNNGQYRHVPKP